MANSSESKLAIERTAQTQLAAQVKALQEENAVLKEDLAFFESIIPADGRQNAGLAINRFKVERGASGQYRYRLLLVQGGKRDREFQGNYVLQVQLVQDGKSAMMNLPRPEQPNNSTFKLNFKYFQRLEGMFQVPVGATVKSVQVRIFENGAPRAEQTYNVL